MKTNELLKQLICGIAKDDHFVQEPIDLKCGHSVCRSCLPTEENLSIECRCGVITDRNLRNEEESVTKKDFLKQQLKNLFEEIEKKTIHQLNNLINDLLILVHLNFPK